LVLGGGVKVPGAGAGIEADFVTHVGSPYTFSPRARRSATTCSMPSLSMVRMALADTRSRTKRFSDSSQKRWECRFGRKRRLVLRFECDTFWPETGRLPVIWQTLDMIQSSKECFNGRRDLQQKPGAKGGEGYRNQAAAASRGPGRDSFWPATGSLVRQS